MDSNYANSSNNNIVLAIKQIAKQKEDIIYDLAYPNTYISKSVTELCDKYSEISILYSKILFCAICHNKYRSIKTLIACESMLPSGLFSVTIRFSPSTMPCFL